MEIELGPLQKEWIARLRAHPERQMKGSLGTKAKDGNYTACCLGEACLMLMDNGISSSIIWHYDTLYSDGVDSGAINEFKLLGLRGKFGPLAHGHYVDGILRTSLVGLNDGACLTWPEIADFIESNPSNVFTKSV